MDKQTALDLLDEKQDFLFSVSDSIWDNPETDYTETVSSGILMDALKKEGFTVTSGPWPGSQLHFPAPMAAALR